MAISDRLNKLTTDITSAYTSIENKGGKIPANKNTNNLSTAIDSIEVIESATAEGESLSLANTKAMPYSDYVVEGKSEQVTRILPDTYTQVEYIENVSTDTKYINTGFKTNNNTKVSIDASLYSTDNGGRFLFGTRNSARTDIFCGLLWTDNKVTGGYGTSGLYQSEIVQSINTRFNLTLDKNLLYHNNILIKTFNTQTFTSENNLYIGTVNTNGSADNQIFKGKIYSCKIWDNGTLIRNMIPCYRNSDSVIGMYDTVNNVFYTNAGTGTFTKGNDVTIPSPSNPSEIHSVADDVNLFDASKINNPTAITVSDNGETITMPIASSGNGATSTNATLKQLCPDLQVGDYIYLNFTRNLGKTYNNLIYLAGSGKEIYNASVYSFNTGTTITQQDLDSIVYLYGNRYSDGETQQCIITDFKIQKNKATPYSPYNQGTVTIKQRGKNLIDNNNLQYDFSNVPNTYNQLETIETGIRYSTTYSSGTPMIIFNTGIDLTSHIGKTIKMKSTISSNAGSIRVGIANADTSLRQYKANTNISNEEISFLVTDDLGEKKYLIYYLAIDVGIGNTADFKNLTLTIDEEPIYEPYQTPHDYIIQTSPLRSLPNGVKDTIEADGIHRRVGRYILPEIATLSSGTALGTQCQYAIYSLSNSKTGGRNYNFISNIIAPANDIYGQYKGYRNSTNIFVMTSTDDTVENFNSKISGSEVLYELATEIIEPLTQNQATTMLDIIKTGSYEGTTNIYTDEDVKPTIKVDYYKKS